MASSQSEEDRRFNKAKMLRNSCRLRKYKSSNYPEVISAVDDLFEEMVRVDGLTLTRKSSIDRLKYHIEFFVTNLYKTYCNDPTRVISYPRDRSKYSDKKSIYSSKFDLSFRYSVEGGKDGKGVINFLERQGYIETFGFQHDRSKQGKSYQSRMRATEKLLDLIESKHSVSEEMLEVDTSKDETVIVKGLKPKPFWVMVVDADGKKKRKKIQRPRKVCKTPDTPKVREMRENLKVINELMDKAEITLDISEEELKELNARMLGDPDPYKQAIDFSRKRLYRVFLDRRLDRGGRFFGPWYQNIFKEYRPGIMIDGAPTLELDYSSLHPNLLYYFAEENPPKGDLYELDGYSEGSRKFLKAVFLRMINSKSPTDAKGSIREDAFYKNKISIPAEFGNLENSDLDPVIDKFMEKHKPLKDFIFKVKDLGSFLQYVDSKIAERVLLYFALKGIPVLPIHDSFRVDARAYPQLEEVMNRVMIESFGRPIWITNDDYLPLLERLSGMIEKQIEEGDYDEEALSTLFNDLNEIAGRMQSDLERLKKLGKTNTGN
jgi:hypothetical protein